MDGGGHGLLGSGRGVRRVVILRPGRIGDYLCATPAVRALRRALPEAELHYVGLPLVADLVARNPAIDVFVPFPGFPGIAEQFFRPAAALAWLAEMQRRRYDLAVQLYGSGVYANPVTLLLGARRTAGFVRPEDGRCGLDAWLPLPQTGPEVDRVLALPRHLGAEPAGRGYLLTLHGADERQAAELLAGLPRPLVGLHCGARDAGRRTTGELGRMAGLPGSVIVLGGSEERAAGRALAAAVAGAGRPCRDLTGRIGLGTLAGVLARLDLLVTSDSGPAHLGYAVGTPTVTIFRSSDPVRYGPPVPGPHAVVDARGGDPGRGDPGHADPVAVAGRVLACARDLLRVA